MTDTPNPNYEELLNGELTELVARLNQKQELKAELDDITAQIIQRREGVIGLASLAKVNIRQTHPSLFKGELDADVGLTDAIVKVFEDINQAWACSPTAIREELECMVSPFIRTVVPTLPSLMH